MCKFFAPPAVSGKSEMRGTPHAPAKGLPPLETPLYAKVYVRIVVIISPLSSFVKLPIWATVLFESPLSVLEKKEGREFEPRRGQPPSALPLLRTPVRKIWDDSCYDECFKGSQLQSVGSIMLQFSA